MHERGKEESPVVDFSPVPYLIMLGFSVSNNFKIFFDDLKMNK